jgi:phage terminase large subunit-like protein
VAVEDERWRRWSPKAQEQAVGLLVEAKRAAQRWRPWYCPDLSCDGKPHGEWNWKHCRADQRPPQWAWFVWLLRGGRGSGKTRSGSEFSRKMTERTHRIAIIGMTTGSIRETLIEGESGILATSPPGQRPDWEPSKHRLTWPNGCIGTTYSAEEPDRLRGPEHGYAWLDEPGHYPLIEDVWSNLLLGLRLGDDPRICATSTPRTTKWMRELIADETTADVQVSTYANLDNLAPTFRKTVLDRYEGTRLGRQELHGELLEDVEGALWNYDIIEPYRLKVVPGQLDRVVIGIDPAGTANRRSDETGIVAVGKIDKHLYVLADRTGKYSPHGWASAAIRLHEQLGADAVVVETNFGGDLVTTNLRNTPGGERLRISTVHSRRGKRLRAEPVVGIYEQGRAHHITGDGDVNQLELLETEQTTWVPDESDSPNRLDAVVHAATDLMGLGGPVEIATPSNGRPDGAASGDGGSHPLRGPTHTSAGTRRVATVHVAAGQVGRRYPPGR